LVLSIKILLIYTLIYMGDFLYSLYNSDYISPKITKINLELFLVVIAILLFSKIWVRIVMLGGILFVMLMQYFYFQYFGAFIQPIGFYQIILNTRETFDIIADEFSTMVIPVTIILGLLISIIILKKLIKVKSFRNNKVGVIILLGVFSYSLYGTYNGLHSKSGKLWHGDAKRIMPLPGVHSSANYMRAFRYFLVGIVPKKILADNVDIFPPLKKPQKKSFSEENNIIFVIGESLRAKQLGILGYKEDTTPRLQKIDGLIAKNIYSAGTMTKVSVSSLLNRVKYPGATVQMMQQKNNLFNLAKQQNYQTYFYSWQNNSQLSILQNFMGRKYIDNYASKEDIKRMIKKHDSFDDNLLKALKKIDLNKGKNFIVLHQRGSHSTYSNQYPKGFGTFQNTYDNTVLYTDYFLDEIIAYLKKVSKKSTYLIFTSDHGELLHEHGKNGHGWFFSEVYKVPFIFYGINSNINNISTKNIQSHFDVSNFVVSLLGYRVNINYEKQIYINGSDVDALAGYLKIKLDSKGSELSIEEIR